MKSRRERMRKEEIQLTIRRIPLAMESNRLLPSDGQERERERGIERETEVHSPCDVFVIILIFSPSTWLHETDACGAAFSPLLGAVPSGVWPSKPPVSPGRIRSCHAPAGAPPATQRPPRCLTQSAHRGTSETSPRPKVPEQRELSHRRDGEAGRRRQARPNLTLVRCQYPGERRRLRAEDFYTRVPPGPLAQF